MENVRRDCRDALLIIALLTVACILTAVIIHAFADQRGARSPFFLVVFFASLRCSLRVAVATALTCAGILNTEILDHGFANPLAQLTNDAVGYAVMNLTFAGAVVLARLSLRICPPAEVHKAAERLTAEGIKRQLREPGGVQRLFGDPLMAEKVQAVLRGKSVNH